MAEWPNTQIAYLPNRPGAEIVYLTLGNGITPDGLAVMPGIQGFDSPALDYAITESPGTAGAHLNSVRVPSRAINIPIYIEGDDRGQFLTRKRALLKALSPLGATGPGRLVVYEGDASSRFIDLWYVGGAEGNEGIDAAGFHWRKYGLQFLALDPYFYAAEVVSRTFRGDAGDGTPFFSSPFFGLHLTQTLSFNGSVTLDVVGDADSWPVWKLTGPSTSATFINHSLGLSFTVAYSLGSGQSLTVDTRPGRKTVLLDEDGSNVWSSLGGNPQLWPVAPYPNTVEIQITGVTSTTSVGLEYRPRFLSA